MEPNSRVIANDSPPFPSFIALRAAHSELLQQDPETTDSKVAREVEDFIKKAQATGAILNNDEERRGAQNILNYWVSVLYRADNVARLATLASYDARLTGNVEISKCPYPGVGPFESEDAQFFFGRQRQIDYLLSRLKEDRLLIIVGPSGSGKTSLVQAGLLPALKKEGATERKYFNFTTIVPGSDPLDNLARMMSQAKKPDVDEATWIEEQVEAFKRDDGHLLKLIGEITDGPAVLFIDQCEQLYELPGNRVAARIEEIFKLDRNSQTILTLVENILQVIQSTDKRHIVILARRFGDYEPHFRRLPKRFREVFEPARVVLPALYASELRDAIEKPAELFGVKFENPGPDSENKNRETIVQALVKEITSEQAGLPLLQFTLPLLWAQIQGNKIPYEAFRKLVSCQKALARTAEEVFAKLDYLDQRTCRRLLTQLIRLDGDLKPHLYPEKRTALYRITGRRSRVDSLIELLSKKQIIRLSTAETPADQEVELIHSSLLLNWPRMVAWVEEKRRARWWSRAVMAGCFALLVALLVFAGMIFVGQRESRTRSYDLARLSSKQIANSRFDLALLFGLAGYKTEDNATTRGNLLKLLYNLQFTPQPARFLASEKFLAADLEFTTEKDTDPSRLAAIDTNGRIDVWDLNWNQPQALGKPETLTSTSQSTYPLRFSPDGKKLATASNDPNVGVFLWDLSTKQKRDLVHNLTANTSAVEAYKLGRVNGLIFSPNGESVFAATQDGQLLQWGLQNPGQPVTPLFKQQAIQFTTIALNTNGTMLAAGATTGDIVLLDLTAKRPKPQILSSRHSGMGTNETIFNLAFSKSGDLLGSSRIDEASIWDLKNRKLKNVMCTGLPPTGLFIAFNADDTILYGYNTDGNIFLWDVNSGEPLPIRLYKQANAATSVSFSGNGKYMALPIEGGVIVWDISSSRVIHRNGGINSLAFRPGSRTLTIAAADALTNWDTQSFKKVADSESQPVSVVNSGVLSLAYSSDGSVLAAGLNNGTISLRDPSSFIESGPSLLPQFPPEVTKDVSFRISKVVFPSHGNSGRLAALVNFSSNVAVEDAASNKVESSRTNEPSERSEVLFWNLADRTNQYWPSKGITTAVSAPTFNHDGRILAWASKIGDQTLVNLWDCDRNAQSQRPVTTQTQNAMITSLVFNSDSSMLAAGFDNGKIELLNSSYQTIAILDDMFGEVVDLAFSAKGDMLISATNRRSIQREHNDNDLQSPPGAITLWDLKTYDQLGDLLRDGHAGPISKLAVSDGLLASGGEQSVDGRVVLWDVDVVGAQLRICKIIDCFARYDEVRGYLENEDISERLYRKVYRIQSLQEKLFSTDSK